MSSDAPRAYKHRDTHDNAYNNHCQFLYNFLACSPAEEFLAHTGNVNCLKVHNAHKSSLERRRAPPLRRNRLADPCFRNHRSPLISCLLCAP